MGVDYVAEANGKTEQDLKDGMMAKGFVIHVNEDPKSPYKYAFVKGEGEAAGYLWFDGIFGDLFSFSAWGVNMFDPRRVQAQIEAIEEVLGTEVLSEHDEGYHELVFGDENPEDTVH